MLHRWHQPVQPVQPRWGHGRPGRRRPRRRRHPVADWRSARLPDRPARLTPLMIDEKLLSILVCPADRGPLLYIRDEVLYNPRLRRAYRIDDGIPVLLVDEAVDVSEEEHEQLIAQASREDPRGDNAAGWVRSFPQSARRAAT